MTTTQEWIDELKTISVLELSERIKALEEAFGVSATASAAVASGHIQVNLGPTARVPAATASPSNSPTALPTTGAQGGAVIAKNGIPCVD